MSFMSQDPWDSYFMDVGDDDSSECESSSDDEIDVLLHGTPQQKKKLQLTQGKSDTFGSFGQHKKQASSSEDEFEKEMNAELNQHIKDLEKRRVSTQEEGETSSNISKRGRSDQPSNPNKDTFYSDVYFDSDEEDETGGNSQHAVLSNDDLLYDPTMDERDQKWVDKQRQKHCNALQLNIQPGQEKKAAKKPSSDALLDCPACLTTVCIDCQRHESYKNQYRAMFVMNCTVDTSERLQCPEQTSKSKKKKKKRHPESEDNVASPPAELSSSDFFHPVKCTECNTVVAVIDDDEIYHFFNVISSHT